MEDIDEKMDRKERLQTSNYKRSRDEGRKEYSRRNDRSESRPKGGEERQMGRNSRSRSKSRQPAGRRSRSRERSQSP